MKVPNSGHWPWPLYQLDRDALLAVYGRLDPGTPKHAIFRELGAWEDTSTYVLGELSFYGGEVNFGAAERNDFLQAWAYGPMADMSLENNESLAGNITWLGRLLGMTPATEVVGGAVRLSVALASLTGDIRFSQLESWRPSVVARN